VSWVEGKLTVTANGSSLNQILRQIERKAGLQITGGVTDERVYGSYGPGSLGDVLGLLLDGTGSNMLLVGSSTEAAELILTPRQGGPTPPNPNALPHDDDEERQDRPPQQTVPPDLRTATPIATPNGTATVQGTTAPGPAAATPVATPSNGASADPASAAPAPSLPKSPNGVLTPDQVAQWLLQNQKPANPK
jgi:hypothetical protein